MLKPRLEKFYEKTVCEDFILLYNFKNISQIPTFEHFILNSRSNLFIKSRLSLLQSFCAFFLGTGHKSVNTRARRSIASFEIREKNLLGLKSTLRGKSLFDFLDKLLIFVLPKQNSSVKAVVDSNSAGSPDFLSRGSSREANCWRKKLSHNAFTITQKSPRYFPEISQFLNFFDSASGFSLLCSLKISHISYQSKQGIIENFRNKDRFAIEASKSQRERLLFQEQKNTLAPFRTRLKAIPKKFTLRNERKKLLLSAFQFPLFFRET